MLTHRFGPSGLGSSAAEAFPRRTEVRRHGAFRPRLGGFKQIVDLTACCGVTPITNARQAVSELHAGLARQRISPSRRR